MQYIVADKCSDITIYIAKPVSKQGLNTKGVHRNNMSCQQLVTNNSTKPSYLFLKPHPPSLPKSKMSWSNHLLTLALSETNTLTNII